MISKYGLSPKIGYTIYSQLYPYYKLKVAIKKKSHIRYNQYNRLWRIIIKTMSEDTPLDEEILGEEPNPEDTPEEAPEEGDGGLE